MGKGPTPNASYPQIFRSVKKQSLLIMKVLGNIFIMILNHESPLSLRTRQWELMETIFKPPGLLLIYLVTTLVLVCAPLEELMCWRIPFNVIEEF